jgi:outer membrane protein OmpU
MAKAAIPDLWLCCTNFRRIWTRRSAAVAIAGRKSEIPSIPLRIPLRRAYLEERGKNMKKLLLATSALVMTAGVAAADGHITLSGDARMGIVDDFGAVGPVFNSRARVKFTLSGESDSGFAFGAEFRADNAGDAASGTAGKVFVSGAFGTLSMGDVDGAANAAVGHVDGVGYTGLSDLNESTFIGGGTKESILYEYSAGSFTGYLSAGQREVAAETWSVAAKYAAGNFTVSLGYEDNDAGTDHVIAGVNATFSTITIKARYGQASGAIDGDQWALSVGHSANGLGITAFYTDDSELGGAEAFGIGGTYDLGGGASFAAGYSSNETTDEDAIDVGLNFSF